MANNLEEGQQKKPIEIGCGLGCLIAFAAIIVGPPYACIILFWEFLKERRFQKKLQAQGRFLRWNDLVGTLEDGKGTLIIENHHKMPIRIWWTEENIPAVSPVDIPSEAELKNIYYLISDEAQPFIEWCFSRYLNPDSGVACLTNAPKCSPAQFCAQFFKSDFPMLQIVETWRRPL